MDELCDAWLIGFSLSHRTFIWDTLYPLLSVKVCSNSQLGKGMAGLEIRRKNKPYLGHLSALYSMCSMRLWHSPLCGYSYYLMRNTWALSLSVLGSRSAGFSTHNFYTLSLSPRWDRSYTWCAILTFPRVIAAAKSLCNPIWCVVTYDSRRSLWGREVQLGSQF